MFGSKFRVLALPVVAVGALALLGVTAGQADAETIASGTGTFSVPLSVETTLAKAGVVVEASGVQVVNVHNGRSVTLGSLAFDLLDDQIDLAGTAYLDLGGTQSAAIHGTSQTFSASSLTVDAAGASALNTALGTCAFTTGTEFGSFTTTYSS